MAYGIPFTHIMEATVTIEKSPVKELIGKIGKLKSFNKLIVEGQKYTVTLHDGAWLFNDVKDVSLGQCVQYSNFK